MRLTVADIKRINKEVEETEIRALQRYVERIEYEAIGESEHGDYEKVGALL
jgi:hypothetical protein